MIIYIEEPEDATKKYYNQQKNLVNIGKDMEKLEPSYIADKNVK